MMTGLAETIQLLEGASSKAVEGSPFHEGERRIQQAQGVREDMEHWGRRVIRDHLPEEHAGFYAQLPYLVVAARDAKGRPWATLLAGEPGFVTAADPRTLQIGATPGPGDALAGALAPGRDLGILGIELHTRRRNRVNGRVREADANALVLAVDQAFGNCPQHIQVRAWRRTPLDAESGSALRSTRPSAQQRRMIERADTFFIATGHGGRPASDPSHGMDASHRGGPAGFVHLDGDGVLVFPDYAGNNHFNTLGNLLLDPRVGLLFVDSARGSLLQLTGMATIDWQPGEAAQRSGAQRMVHLAIQEVIEQPGVLPLRFAEPATASEALDVVERVDESEDVTSFLLARRGHAETADWKPGQHLPIEVPLPPDASPASRTYSLSNAPGSRHYRISVKREPLGRVSRQLHAALQVGATLRAGRPAGDFFLDLDRLDAEEHVVLVAAGIGITPMASILHALAKRRPAQPVSLVHGVRDGAHHPLASELRDLVEALPRGQMHVRYSRPRPEDQERGAHDDSGRIDAALLERLVPLANSTFYLCGPLSFMGEIRERLEARGVPEARIHFEAF